MLRPRLIASSVLLTKIFAEGDRTATEPGHSQAVVLRGAGHRRSGLRAAEPGGNGGTVHGYRKEWPSLLGIPAGQDVLWENAAQTAMEAKSIAPSSKGGAE